VKLPAVVGAQAAAVVQAAAVAAVHLPEEEARQAGDARTEELRKQGITNRQEKDL